MGRTPLFVRHCIVQRSSQAWQHVPLSGLPHGNPQDACTFMLLNAHMRCMQEQYPAEWPSFFSELTAMAGEGAGAVDMFCRILLSLDDDIISLDVPRCLSPPPVSIDANVVSLIGTIIPTFATFLPLLHWSRPRSLSASLRSRSLSASSWSRSSIRPCYQSHQHDCRYDHQRFQGLCAPAGCHCCPHTHQCLPATVLSTDLKISTPSSSHASSQPLSMTYFINTVGTHVVTTLSESPTVGPAHHES